MTTTNSGDGSSNDEGADVLVLGGGPAGLAAAAALVRQLHTVLMLDGGSYRNDGTAHMHTIPTWDRKTPDQVRLEGRNELLQQYSTFRYTQAEVAEVTTAATNEGSTRFQATATDGRRWTGRKLVLATGSEDIFPDIEGYAECWPSCILHCLLCQGYEHRGCTSAGVLALDALAAPPLTLMVARQLLQLAGQGTIYTHGANESLVDAIQAVVAVEPRWAIDQRRIVRLEKGPGGGAAELTLHFDDGSSKTEGFLAAHPRTRTRGPFAQQLDLALSEQGDIKTFPPFNQTSRRGVFVGGDAGFPMKTLANALASGGFAGGGAMMQVQADKMGHDSVV